MNNYNCRYPDGRLKLVLPEEIRKDLYCPNCDYQLHGPGCLFSRPTPTPINYHPITHKNPRLSEQAMIDGIKRRWQELGHQPKMIEVTSPCTGGHISASFHGGFREAVRQAAAQLEVET